MASYGSVSSARSSTQSRSGVEQGPFPCWPEDCLEPFHWKVPYWSRVLEYDWRPLSAYWVDQASNVNCLLPYLRSPVSSVWEGRVSLNCRSTFSPAPDLKRELAAVILRIRYMRVMVRTTTISDSDPSRNVCHAWSFPDGLLSRPTGFLLLPVHLGTLLPSPEGCRVLALASHGQWSEKGMRRMKSMGWNEEFRDSA